MVDIGCGIGGSSRHISRKFGCTSQGITLSPVQAARANELSAAAGLGDRCKFQVCWCCLTLALPWHQAGALRGLFTSLTRASCRVVLHGLVVGHCAACVTVGPVTIRMLACIVSTYPIMWGQHTSQQGSRKHQPQVWLDTVTTTTLLLHCCCCFGGDVPGCRCPSAAVP